LAAEESIENPHRGGRVGSLYPLIIVALVGVCGAIVSFWLTSAADHARIRSALELRAEWRARDFEHKLRILANPIEALAALLAASDRLDAGLFQRVASRSHAPNDPLRRLVWAPRVVRSQTPLDAPGTVPADRDGEYFPAEVEQTFNELRPLGIADMAADPVSRETIERSRDEGRPLSTPPLALFDSPVTGYIIFWPVYRGDARPPATVEERRARLRGFVLGSFALEAALNAAILDTPQIIESIHFFVGSDMGSLKPDASYSAESGLIERDGDLPAVPPPGGLRLARSFDLFGQHWDLLFDFDAADVLALQSSDLWTIPAGVLLLTGLLMAYLAREQNYRRLVENRVAERTADLRAVNEALAAEIAARRKTQEQLVQAQKMEAVGNLTGGMAHDFNNLLGVIIGNLDLLPERQMGDAEAQEITREALDAALRGADLKRRLLAFARRQPLQPERTEVNRLVAGITNLLKRTLGENVEITLKLDENLWPITVDPAQLAASLTNLATNARDAMPNGGQLTIVTSNRHLDEDYASQHPDVLPGDYGMIEVTDSGTGIPPDSVSHIFEPFYTTKEQGKGTGLGLSMVFGFMKQSGGHINVYSEVGIGTTFRLYLPRVNVESGVAAAVSSEPLARGGGETVLAVEDNANMRRIVVRQLTELGYRVLEAENVPEAIRVLESERVDLLLTDVVMPGGGSGYELARAAQSRWPRMKVVLTSGFPDLKINGNGNAPDIRLLSKPYRREDLARVIVDALERGANA